MSYVLETQRRLKEMAVIAGENMLESQEEQKRWYDRRALLCEFGPVLVLLLTTADKLMAQWQSPYQVLAREGKVTYLVDMHDRKKRHKLGFPREHMLKAFHVHMEAVGYMEEDVLGEGRDDIPVWKEEVAVEAKFGDELSN